MIKTIEQIREQLNRVIDVIDVIAFNEKTSFKTYKRLQKVSKNLFRLSYSVITDNTGLLCI